MLDNITGFHLELTNICTLKCSRCARTDLINRFPSQWKNYQLNLNHLKYFLDIDLFGKQFLLCGNYGDPIYYDDLFQLLIWIKLQGATVHLVTNGSYRTEKFWNRLAELFGKKDTITFSIDGLPSNFTKYRVNADWPSIEQGIKIMTQSDAQVEWKYIPFSYNVDNIEEARQLSKELGIDQFTVEPSDRWDKDADWLKPNESLVNQKLPSKIKWHKKDEVELDPKCKNTNNQHFITATGYYVPCCFLGDHRFYYKTEFYKHREEYQISSTRLSKILKQNNFYDSLESTKPEYCTFNCPKL